jgi:para-nitrobenzyl esterase
MAVVACGRGGDEPPPVLDPSSRRSIAQGELVGFRSSESAHAWRGIPFAAPPVGELRWRAPRPPAPWQGVREALAFGPACVQFAGPIGAVPGMPEVRDGEPSGTEDCLHLNVFAPRSPPGEVPRGGERLPVMLWIHGGGNTIGTSATYDGSVLASTHRLVVVTTNYRLGVFGWLSHPALAGPGASADDRSGNYGTLDLVRALEWIRDNIGAFGGDPDRVTIFGESAGGRNVFSLLASPRAARLFHRAIAQSGGTGTLALDRARGFRDDPEAPGEEHSSGELLLVLLERDGRAENRAAAKAALRAMPAAEVAVLLRDRSAHEILSFFDGSRMGGLYDVPQLLRDGHVLPAEPLPERFRRPGSYSAVPVILGSNRDENKLFMLASSDAVARISRVPLWLKDERRYDVMAHYQALAWKAEGVDEPARALRASQGPTVFAYRFDWDEEPRFLWLDFAKLLGAAHGLEIPFVFGRLTFAGADRFLFDEARRPAAEDLSRKMMSYWSEFAHSGDPGRGRAGDLPRWPAWDASAPDAPRFMILDTEAGGGLRPSSDAVTLESVIERAEADPRFRDQHERCELYRLLVRWGRTLTPEQYAAGNCRDHPLDAYPWES